VSGHSTPRSSCEQFLDRAFKQLQIEEELGHLLRACYRLFMDRGGYGGLDLSRSRIMRKGERLVLSRRI